MTYSVLGFDPTTGDLGVAVQSKTPNTGSITPHGNAGIGCVATQAFGNPRQALRSLELMDQGFALDQIVEQLLDGDEHNKLRQIALINNLGETFVYTGSDIQEYGGYALSHQAKNCCAQGNLLASSTIPEAMTQAFTSTRSKNLEEKLIASLFEGQNQGGELRGMQSAALMVFRKNGGYQGNSDLRTDIRIFDHPKPIEELRRCYQLHELSYFESEPEELIEVSPEIESFLASVLISENFLKPDFISWEQQGVEALIKFLNWSNYGARARTDNLIDKRVLKILEDQYKTD